MKLVLKSLSLKNFRSVAEAELQFDPNGMVLLQGPSGAGKSTINLAIAYVFGFCPVPQNQLTRWGSDDDMKVSLDFLLDGELIHLFRSDKGASISGPGNGELLHGTKNVNARLQSLLKISPDMLGALTYRPQQEPGAFIRKTDAEKKEFLSQILRLDEFENAIDIGNANIKKLETSIQLTQKDVEHLSRAVAEAEKMAPPEIDEKEIQQTELTIAELKSRIASNSYRLSELEELSPEAAEKKKLQEDAGRHLDNAIKDEEKRRTQHAKKTRDCQGVVTNYKNLQSKHSQLSQQLRALERQQESLLGGVCPTCDQGVTDGAAAAKLHTAWVTLTEQVKKVTLTQEQLDELAKYEEESLEQFVPNPNIDKLYRLVARFNSEFIAAQEKNKASLAQLKREELESHKTVAQLTRFLESARINAATTRIHKAMLDVKRSDLEASQSDLAKQKASLAKEQDFVALVGNQGFLGAIFEEVLQDISADVNNILGLVPNTSNVTMQFKTESVTQKGTVKKSIVPVVSVGGNTGPFEAVLSGGMKTMVMLATDLAVARVIANRAGIQPGWLVLDEPFDGADSESREAMLELLAKESSERLVLVVDHSVDSKGLFSKSILVSMTSGVTSIG